MNNVQHTNLQSAKARRYFSALLLLLPAIVFLVSLAAISNFLGTEKPSSSTEAEFIGQPVETQPSRWATDSAVLQLESEITDLATRHESESLEEPELLPPIMDFEVNFEEE